MVSLFESDTTEDMKERASLKLSRNIILAEVFLLVVCEYATLTGWFLPRVLVILHDLRVFLVGSLLNLSILEEN